MLLLLLAFVSITRNKIIYERENALTFIYWFWVTNLDPSSVASQGGWVSCSSEGTVGLIFFSFFFHVGRKCVSAHLALFRVQTPHFWSLVSYLGSCWLAAEWTYGLVCLRSLMLPLGLINSSSSSSFCFVMKWNIVIWKVKLFQCVPL